MHVCVGVCRELAKMCPYIDGYFDRYRVSYVEIQAVEAAGQRHQETPDNLDGLQRCEDCYRLMTMMIDYCT